MGRKIIIFLLVILFLFSSSGCVSNAVKEESSALLSSSETEKTESKLSVVTSSAVSAKPQTKPTVSLNLTSKESSSDRVSPSSEENKVSSKQHSSAASSQIEISSQASSALASQPLPPEKKELIAGEEVGFVFSFPKGTDIKILQLSDIQLITPDTNGMIVWRYVSEAVERAKPNLIVLPGDIVERSFDHSGELWLEVCRNMDTYGIPWLVIFGNHDRESKKGVRWQMEQIEKTKFGVIAPIKKDVPGCNYSVALKEGERYKYILWMLDTHGTLSEYRLQNPDQDIVHSEYTIFNRQIAWMQEKNIQITNKLGEQLPSLMFMHVPPSQSLYAMLEKYRTTYSTFPFTPNEEGDFGRAEELPGGFVSRIFSSAKEIGCVGMFFAHQHKIAMSVMYQGIRLTWGLKTGRSSYHSGSIAGLYLDHH